MLMVRILRISAVTGRRLTSWHGGVEFGREENWNPRPPDYKSSPNHSGQAQCDVSVVIGYLSNDRLLFSHSHGYTWTNAL